MSVSAPPSSGAVHFLSGYAGYAHRHGSARRHAASDLMTRNFSGRRGGFWRVRRATASEPRGRRLLSRSSGATSLKRALSAIRRAKSLSHGNFVRMSLVSPSPGSRDAGLPGKTAIFRGIHPPRRLPRPRDANLLRKTVISDAIPAPVASERLSRRFAR